VSDVGIIATPTPKRGDFGAAVGSERLGHTELRGDERAEQLGELVLLRREPCGVGVPWRVVVGARDRRAPQAVVVDQRLGQAGQPSLCQRCGSIARALEPVWLPRPAPCTLLRR